GRGRGESHAWPFVLLEAAGGGRRTNYHSKTCGTGGPFGQNGPIPRLAATRRGARECAPRRGAANHFPKPPRNHLILREQVALLLAGQVADALQHAPHLAVVDADLLGNLLGAVALQAQFQDLPVQVGELLQEVVELVHEGDERVRRRLAVEDLGQVVAV